MNDVDIQREQRKIRLQQAMTKMPLVAILRGLTPQKAVEVGQVLVENGLHILEVPLNSPDPFESISLLRQNLPQHVIVGAGTVLRESDIEQLQRIQADIVVMPHCSPTLISKSIHCGLEPFAGVFTPTEAFCAVDAGAQFLKIFPSDCNPLLPKALKSVLPPHIQMLAVGGVQHDNVHDFPAVQGFGVGSSLFTPKMEIIEIAKRAAQFCVSIQKWKQSL